MNEPVYSSDWVSGRLDHWPALMRDLVGEPIRVLEVGTHEGRSAIWIAQHIATHPRATLDSVDNCSLGGQAARDRAYANVRATGLHTRIRLLRSASVAWLIRHHQPYDLVYIDGDHRGRAVLEDSVLAWRLLEPGGYLVWDDYGYYGAETHPPESPPALAIDAFRALYSREIEELHKGYQIIVRRRT